MVCLINQSMYVDIRRGGDSFDLWFGLGKDKKNGSQLDKESILCA